MTTLNKAAFTPIMDTITEFFKDLGVFKFVGGCVRDILMEVEPKDYDLITPALPDEVEAYIRAKGKKAHTVGKRFGTIGVIIDGQKVEITTYRGEDYTGRKCFTCGFLTMKEKCPNVIPGTDENNGETICGANTYLTRKPEVQYTKHLDQDLMRRDFTINAIALDPISGKLHDPFFGQIDMANRVIRAVGKPKARFKEDPLRILRAIRFAARFGYIEEETKAQAVKMRWELQRIAKERIIMEINSMFQLPVRKLEVALHLLWDMQIWQVILPEMQLQWGYDQRNPHHKNYLHAHSKLCAMSAAQEWDENAEAVIEPPAHSREITVWTALLHDIGKPFTAEEKDKIPGEYRYHDHDRLGAMMVEKFMTYYRFSNDDIDFAVSTVRDHLKDDNWLRAHDNGAKE